MTTETRINEWFVPRFGPEKFRAFVGLLFLPWTTLAYVIVWSPVGGVDGAEWLLVVLGLILDIASYSARATRGVR